MPEKVGESPYLTYIDPGLNKDDIQIVGHIHTVQYGQTPNGLAPIEVGGVRTSELGTLYIPVVGGDYFYNYDRNTGAVTLPPTYASGKITENMVVIYTGPFIPPSGGSVNIDRYKSDVDSRRKSFISAEDKQIIKDQQFNKLNNESVTIDNTNGETGGVISLSEFAQEGTVVTNRLMPSKLSSTFGDGLLNNITESSAIQSMLGTARSSLVKKKIITHPNPSFLESKLKTIFPKMAPDKRRLLSTENFAVNAKKCQTSLIPNQSPKIQALKKVTEIVKAKQGFFGFSGLGMTISKVTKQIGINSGIGRSKQNVMAHKQANSIFGVIKQVGTKIVDKLPVFSDKKKEAISNLFDGKVPDMIDEGGFTNLHKLTKKTSNINIPTPNINNPISNIEKFDGFNTPADYEFSFVSSPDEITAELNKSIRGPRFSNNQSIGALFLGHSGQLYGPEEKVNAQFIHEENNRLDAQDFGLQEVTNNAILYGIQSHYIITRAGNIQRGRPVSVPRNAQFTNFSQTGLKLTFIATESTPINKQQEDAFDKFLEGFFRAFPEYPVYADYQWNLEDAAGYNVVKKIRDGITSKYKIVYKYEDISEFTEMPIRTQMTIAKPPVIAEPSSTGKKILSPSEANELIQSEAFQKQLDRDLDLAMNKMEGLNLSLNGASKDEIISKVGAENLPDGDPREKFEKDFAFFENEMDKISKNANSYLKAFNGTRTNVKKVSEKLVR